MRLREIDLFQRAQLRIGYFTDEIYLVRTLCQFAVCILADEGQSSVQVAKHFRRTAALDQRDR